jgi:hypothetical protein
MRIVYRISGLCAVVFALSFLLVPFASADIIKIQNATGPCSLNGLTTGGGTICAGNTTPFSLTALENGTQALQAVVGTQTAPVYLVTNDTGSTTFTLTFNGLLVSNQFLTCQVSGNYSSDSCSITGALGTVGTGAQYGPPSGQTTNWNPGATLTFTGVAIGSNFDLAFASFGNGASGTLTGVPEPSSLALLAAGLFGLLGFARLTKRSS